MAVPTGFVGRQHDVERVRLLVEGHPLVTLCGPGGVGKTRLAGEVASAVAAGFPGGASLVELSGHEPDDDVELSVARQLGVESLAAFRLRSADAPTLVVLDNCESALASAAATAVDLLEGAEPTVTVLATSRTPLRIAGERVVSIEPLPLPATGSPEDLRASPAVDLFLQRAEAAGAPWRADDDTLATVGRLVARLDGLPLAIELAAARSRSMSPAQLERFLDQRLDLLVSTEPEDRHRSLRAVIRASYEPLDPTLQRTLRALSVMGSPFDLDIAHGLTGSDGGELVTLERLSELVDRSLVALRPGDGGTGTYRLLDSIRAFGLEQLEETGEAEAVHDRYVATAVALADGVVAQALDSFSPDVLGRIRANYAHLAAAVAWCVEHDETAERANRLFLPFYGPAGARTESVELARRVRQRWPEPGPLGAEAIAVMATCAFLTGDADLAAALAEEALSIDDATPLAGMIAHRTLGFIAAVSGAPDGAERHLGAAIELALPFSPSFARELQASWAAVVTDPARIDELLELLDEVIRGARANDEMITVQWATATASYHLHRRGDHDAAVRSAEAALELAHTTGLPWSVPVAHRVRAGLAAFHDGWDAAAPHYRTALDASLGAGDVEGMATTVRAAAGAACHLQDDALARELWATMPTTRGTPVLRSIFHAEEQRLVEELGAPVPIDVTAQARRARELFGPRPGDGEVVAAVGGAATPGGEVVRFGDYTLDLDRCELRHEGRRVHLEPQVYDVLVHLVRERNRVVSKNELLDTVWGDRFVSESALSSRIADARRATGDDGRTQAVIRTVHGKGFRFVASVDGDVPVG